MTPAPVTTIYTNPIFGKINPPELSQATSSAGFNFTLDTVEGVPVTATSAANVYFIPDTPVRFGYQDKISLIAKNFGIDTSTVQYTLSGREAIFQDGGSTLKIDIGNFNFKYDGDIAVSSLQVGSVTKSETDIVNDATNFLKSVGRYPQELATGTTNVIYLTYDLSQGNFVNVERAGQASAVEVDFYRPSVNGIDIVTPKFFNSQNYVVMSYSSDTPTVIKAQINFFEKDDSQFGVYPVISGDAAWAELKSGKGLLVAGRAGVKNISIKKMGLYYLDPDTYQPYLEPVYVFIGDNDFVAYVPAVNGNYLVK